MRAILFAPHNDDETLFAFYQLLEYQPTLVVCLRSVRQLVQQGGPHHSIREHETARVAEMVGVEYLQWDMPDLKPRWDVVSEWMFHTIGDDYDVVIAPAYEDLGHEDHNAVATIAVGLTDAAGIQLIRYYTYERGSGRTRKGVPVHGTLEQEELKVRALLCYESQIRHPPTTAWFPGGEYEDLTEYLA
jgi:LmbE family N-acetylglucosaminyl deacetylase